MNKELTAEKEIPVENLRYLIKYGADKMNIQQMAQAIHVEAKKLMEFYENHEQYANAKLLEVLEEEVKKAYSVHCKYQVGRQAQRYYETQVKPRYDAIKNS